MQMTCLLRISARSVNEDLKVTAEKTGLIINANKTKADMYKE
jgi:hypothetical protein